MIELKLLQALVTFQECKTLSLAAERLYTSQPALTRDMKKLEEELHVALFKRTKNHLELTEVGEVACEYASRVLKEEDYFEERVKAYQRSLNTISIGYCAPIPQTVLNPMLNSLFEGMTIQEDMKDDKDFLSRLKEGSYQLAVVHEKPNDPLFYSQKCGHEDLYISVLPSDPLSFYPEVHLKDLDNRNILLLSQIGFWMSRTKKATPNTHYLLQVERDSFQELVSNSDYPSFTSSYYLKRGLAAKGRINIELADKECHTDFYIVCLAKEKKRFEKIFAALKPTTIS